MKKLWIYILSSIVLLIIITGICFYRYAYQKYDGEQCRVNISRCITDDGLHRLLVDSLGRSYGNAVYNIWKLRGGTLRRAHGSYLVRNGENAITLANRFRRTLQDPINATLPENRSLDKAFEQFASNFDFTPEELIKSRDSIMNARNVSPQLIMAYFLPDTYQFYWTTPADKVINRLLDEYDLFWNDDRQKKASSLGLNKIQVSTLASIVEEETAKNDERPLIARLYLNRLARNMKLQADPTVKYALADPSLRRILNTHLSVNSPYNTYQNAGLPPGPIRPVNKRTLDAVLNAPQHDYLFMCAKEDFSGYHNFAKTYSQHQENARRYQRKLNEMKIK